MIRKRKQMAAVLLLNLLAIVGMFLIYKRAHSALQQIFNQEKTDQGNSAIMREIMSKRKEVNDQLYVGRQNNDVVKTHNQLNIAINQDIPLSHDNHQTYYVAANGKLGLDFHCKTCAYLPSSGRLLGTKAGSEIDNNDCVIRMNVAPVRGFEEDYGKKTTIRVICFMSTPGMNDDIMTGEFAPERMIFWGVHPLKQPRAYRITVDAMEKYPHIKYYFFRPETEELMSELFEKETGRSRMGSNSWLSTGLFAMKMAFDICDHINIYGMIHDQYCQQHQNDTAVFHYYGRYRNKTECGYYDKQERTKRGGHRFVTEKAVLGKWANQHNATFYYPSWDGYNFTENIQTPFVMNDRMNI
ncbi:alpha-N-acetyl-neuraminyl-2,3-beta-galactosyl-1,3-N-acetyl-galactosaminide alpha-2,6-sialyltransferase-like [Ptychodera flava]|uniref:alpha-N-acetyl-neuraminyl-2,3-beta-galactosyl-1, 3-N-acetyl-galactosaminide alpha-2,6-sialyltransferase-like n=1 Tax=Ptychodera flava TaxID=63121 RepID=UPI003969C74A